MVEVYSFCSSGFAQTGKTVNFYQTKQLVVLDTWSLRTWQPSGSVAGLCFSLVAVTPTDVQLTPLFPELPCIELGTNDFVLM